MPRVHLLDLQPPAAAVVRLFDAGGWSSLSLIIRFFSIHALMPSSWALRLVLGKGKWCVLRMKTRQVAAACPWEEMGRGARRSRIRRRMSKLSSAYSIPLTLTRSVDFPETSRSWSDAAPSVRLWRCTGLSRIYSTTAYWINSRLAMIWCLIPGSLWLIMNEANSQISTCEYYLFYRCYWNTLFCFMILHLPFA